METMESKRNVTGAARVSFNLMATIPAKNLATTIIAKHATTKRRPKERAKIKTVAKNSSTMI